MKVLYICNANPFGTMGGGDKASHAFLRAFCDLKDVCVDLICDSKFKTESDPNMKISNIIYVPKRTIWNKLMSVFTGHMNRYIDVSKSLLRREGRLYDLVVFNHSHLAGPLVELVHELGVKTVTIHHNYEKKYFSDNNHGLYKAIFIRHVVKWEKIAYRKSDLNLFLTSQDLEDISRAYGKSSGKNFVLGVFEYQDYKRMSVKEKSDRPPLSFVITGSLFTYQTQDAVRFFFKDLYRYLPDDSLLLISGRGPKRQLKKLCSAYSNVVLIPDCVDMNDIVCQADIYICATRLGSGLKLRVMDGLRAGLPVLVHSCSARGYNMFYDETSFKVFSTPEEFGDGLKELIGGVRGNKFDKRVVQDRYEEFFSYESGLRRLENIVATSGIIPF